MQPTRIPKAVTELAAGISPSTPKPVKRSPKS